MREINVKLTNGEYEYLKQQAILGHTSINSVVRDTINICRRFDRMQEALRWLRKNSSKTKSKSI